MDDRNLAVGWYRFYSSGGWKIPETVVPASHCSAYYPGWLVGSHPSVGDGEVTRTVCFNEGSYICYWNREIRVKNCTDYFVYQLWPTPYTYGVYCTVTDSALGDPCVTHTVLDQPWRSTDCSNTECSAGTWMSDGNLAVGWYRFNSSGGWKIPETVVPVNHCSGYYPGWLAGAHPSVGDGEVTRAVCFIDGSYICNWNQEIRVKNCIGYFVYQLWPSPSTSAVYCTDPASVPTEEPQETTAEPQSTASEPDTCSRIDGGIIGTSYFPQSSTSAGKEWDLQTSTRGQSEGSLTGESTQDSVSAGDTSSDEDYPMILIKVTSEGGVTVEEVKEALREKLREMFDDPDPQIELVEEEEEEDSQDD
ncbi:uncharacterized protein LOC129710948 [Leucoraja erinacea]|uniref:uncharacterized protein LOC129710948 n=1 Tax=Leucoraja erinaceus TaxID=7782 RepID=UPI002457E846|nr:uncharacterized protein LOC129710948 [Leucoraja erinacea]